jgi:hypothetical protein
MRPYCVTLALLTAPTREQARALLTAGWHVCSAGCCATLRFTAPSGGAAARSAPAAVPAAARHLVDRATAVTTTRAAVIDITPEPR